MRNLKLKEVSEMVFRYMQDNQTNLLEAYEQVSIVLKEGCPFNFETVKQYLFHNNINSFIKENNENL